MTASAKKSSALGGDKLGGLRVRAIPVIVVCALFYFVFCHDDLMETANHARILLDCTFKGQFFDFYNVVMAHDNTLYYLNNAHYNIVCYILYAVWQLPVWLVGKLSGIAISEYFYVLWAKALGTAAFAACGVLMQKIALGLHYTEKDSDLAALAFWLNPIAFFAVMLLGQYDTICLLPMLAALLYWQKKQYWRFALLIGVAMVFKFFPLLLFLPLLMLVEKRPLHCLGYFFASLWLFVPTTLLFRGRVGDMGVFNDMMIDRVFVAKLPGGLDDIPVFFLLYAVLLLGCYLYRPRSEEDAVRLMPWLGLTVFGLLFLFTLWHPQWLILLVPFSVLTTLGQKQRAPWLYLSALFFVGYWLCINFNFPAQMEINLFCNGIFGGLVRPIVQTAHNSLTFYLALLPRVSDLSPVVFAAPLLASLIFKVPLGPHSLGDRLAGQGGFGGAAKPLAPAPDTRRLIWGVFIVCIVCIWLGSTIAILLKAAL